VCVYTLQPSWLIVAQNHRHVPTHILRSKVQRVQLRGNSATFRVTLPSALVVALDLEKGDEIIWTWDATAKRLTVSKGPARR